jgi:hypothetical protein
MLFLLYSTSIFHTSSIPPSFPRVYFVTFQSYLYLISELVIKLNGYAFFILTFSISLFFFLIEINFSHFLPTFFPKWNNFHCSFLAPRSQATVSQRYIPKMLPTLCYEQRILYIAIPVNSKVLHWCICKISYQTIGDARYQSWTNTRDA